MRDPCTLPEAAERRQVEAMAGYGLPEEDIARVLDIDVETLRRHCHRELETGQIKANARVAESLFRQATGEGRQAVTAAIFWLKTRARWKEAQENGAAGGAPVAVTIVRFADAPAEPARARPERMLPAGPLEGPA